MENKFFSNDYIIDRLDSSGLVESKVESNPDKDDIDWNGVKEDIDNMDCTYISWKQFTNEIFKIILKNS